MDSPWSRKESDTTDRLSLSLSCSIYKIQEKLFEKVLDLKIECSKAGRHKSNTKQSIAYYTSAIIILKCNNS